MYQHILKKRYVSAGLAVMLSGLIFIGCKEQPITQAFGASPTVVQTVPAPQPSAYDLSTAIAKVAQTAIPAVVHIEVTQRSEVNNPMMPFENNPFFHFFFNGPSMPRKFKQEMKGNGSAGGSSAYRTVAANSQSRQASRICASRMPEDGSTTSQPLMRSGCFLEAANAK